MKRRSFIVSTGVTTVGVPLAARAAAAEASGSVKTAGPKATAVTLKINGREHAMTIEPRVTLLDAIRDYAGLTGTKKGCDQGTCGACTVMVNGRRVDSCLTLAMMHEHDEITTIEGLASGAALSPLQAAFIEHDGFQCGFCTPGQIVSATAMMSEGHALDEQTVRTQMSGNICRCGCYPHIVDAILSTAKSS